MSKLSNPDLENLPLLISGVELSDMPNKFIGWNNNGDIFATRNFGDTVPTWRKYKRLGWALRYVNEEQSKPVGDRYATQS